jgi:hypothetical protein
VAEVSEYLVGSPAFKAGGTGDPRPAGSIPVHLRHHPQVVQLVPGVTRFGQDPRRLRAAGAGHGARRRGLTTDPASHQSRTSYARPMKKIVMLIVVIALIVVAAKKLKEV